MMTNGLGAIIGGYASGAVVDAFSVYADGRLVSREWMDIWLIFAAYALVIGILFAWYSSINTSRRVKQIK